jgi:integrase/recombinase XerD
MDNRLGKKLDEVIGDGRLCEEFLEDLLFRRRASANTVQAYGSDLKKFADYLSCERHTGATCCSRDDVLLFLSLCENVGESSRTRARRLSCLRRFFAFLENKGRIEESPVAGLKSAKIPMVLPHVISHDEMDALLEAGRHGSRTHRRNGMLLELMYATGLRISEAIRIRMEHLMLGDGAILVELGKGSKDRIVLIPPITRIHLEEYIRDIRPLILDTVHSSWVFPTSGGKPLDRQAAWRGIKELGREAGLKTSLHPHLLRHTCATHLLENGCDLLTVQALLGHADISTTEIYTHILEERKRKVFASAHPRAK